jgi:hypothetical protein
MKQQQLQQHPQQPNVDLADKQSFPSLGIGNKSTMKKAVPYTAAQDFAASIRKSSPSTSSNLYPLVSLQRSAAPTTTTNQGTIPDVSSVDNFPSLSTPSTKNLNGPSTMHKIKKVTASSGGTSQNATSNLSIESMKGILGPVGYKAMKTYTREFVNHEMPADSYVDHMASLFPNGYTDVHFWNFVPELIRSFPSTADQDGAFAYMENLHRMKNGALNHEAHYHNSKVATSSAATAAPHSQQPKSSTSYATLASIHSPAQQQSSISAYTPTSLAASVKVGGKPKANSSASAWGGGGVTASTNSTDLKPASTTRMSSSTQSSTTNNTSKKKGGGSKQRNELRALAFGL